MAVLGDSSSGRELLSLTPWLTGQGSSIPVWVLVAVGLHVPLAKGRLVLSQVAAAQREEESEQLSPILPTGMYWTRVDLEEPTH